MYVGTDDGLLFSDKYDDGWRVLKDSKCRGYYYDEDSNVILFAFNDGIYHLRLDASNRKKLLKITAGSYDCHAVFFRNTDLMLAAAVGDLLYIGTYSGY